MAAGSLLALLDDIATILDDVAAMSKVAAKKTAGVLGDDLALNAQQVTGVNAERELPVVWAVAKGSFVNKAILVPAALAISAFVPWLITPLLVIGGAFLCFEGFEKLAHKYLHSKEEDARHHAEHVAHLNDTATDMVALEKEKIKGAVRTDFILSAEIIVIALGTVEKAPFNQQVMGQGEGFVQRRGQNTLFRGEVAVARRHGQPVGLPDGRAPHQLDGKTKVSNQPSDHRHLLQIFLTEVSPVGLHNVEQFSHHDADAVEMARPEGSFHDHFQFAEVEPQGGWLRIHFRYRRGQHNVAASRFQHPVVIVGGAGVAGKVVGVVELGRVYKNAGHNQIIRLPGRFNKAHVAFVQGTHCRDKANELNRTEGGQVLAQGSSGVETDHRSGLGNWLQ